MTTTPDPLADLRQAQAVARKQRDDTAYLEGLLDRISSLEIENAALQAQNNLLKTRVLPSDWYHTKTAIWRPYTGPKRSYSGRTELLARRLQSGLLITRHADLWLGLIAATKPTPENFFADHGEDATDA